MAEPQEPPPTSTSLVPISVKEHSKPIIYGIAANILSGGVPAVIAWIAAHAALASGFLNLPLAILLGSVVMFLLTATAYYGRLLLQKRKRKKAETSAIETRSQLSLPEPAPKLDFKIDVDGSQVRVGDGSTTVRRINAEIKLRCEKASSHVEAVRAFHVSLHRSQPDNGELTIIPQEHSQTIRECSGDQRVVSGEDGWTIADKMSSFRVYYFHIQITPKIQFSLAADHFLRVTLDAVGQKPISQNVYVETWHGAISKISLHRSEELPLTAQLEIDRLNIKLSSYQKTNEQLGEKAKEYQEKIKELQERHRIELTTTNLEKNALKEDLESAERAKAKLAQDLANEKKLKASLEISYEISRREVAEVKAEANAQTNTYELTFKGMSEELKAARHDTEQANLRADQETNQRKEFIRLYHETDQILAVWKPIIEHAKAQAAQIDEWVRMKESIPGKLLLRRERMVTLEIRIYNGSLYPISINPKDIVGKLRFKAKPLSEQIQTPPDEPAIKDLEPKCTALIKLEQPLRVFEAERIQESREGADNNGLFWLGDLYIPISAKNTPVPVRALPLIILPDYISLDVSSFSYDK